MSETARLPSILNKPAWRRYIIRFTIAMSAYAVVLSAMVYALNNGVAPPKPWLYLVAVAPAIPVAAVILIVLRYLQEEDDEYQRMLNMRAFVGATGMTLAICTGWGLMQWFAGLPKVSLFYVFPMFYACQAFSTAWTRWRAR
ncbi:MAG: hypothetical protein ACXWKR_17645 [Phenylobacterium sp.]